MIMKIKKDEAVKAGQATLSLLDHWRKEGPNITLKAHIMEKHVCTFNERWGIGDKVELFIEQGHQVGIKDNGHTEHSKRKKQP
jgi:hypothetical protein